MSHNLLIIKFGFINHKDFICIQLGLHQTFPDTYAVSIQGASSFVGFICRPVASQRRDSVAPNRQLLQMRPTNAAFKYRGTKDTPGGSFPAQAIPRFIAPRFRR